VPRPCVVGKSGYDAARTILLGMPSGLHRTYGAHRLHFITCSCYRRLTLLHTAHSHDSLLSILEETQRVLSICGRGIRRHAGAHAPAHHGAGGWDSVYGDASAEAAHGPSPVAEDSICVSFIEQHSPRWLAPAHSQRKPGHRASFIRRHTEAREIPCFWRPESGTSRSRHCYGISCTHRRGRKPGHDLLPKNPSAPATVNG
jgi:hypothetical protein